MLQHCNVFPYLYYKLQLNDELKKNAVDMADVDKI